MLLLSTTVFYAQFAATNLDDFNYLTKGYQIQTESGLDMKQGYTLQKISGRPFSAIVGNDTRFTEFYSLFKEGIDKPKATLLILYNSKTPNEKTYFCIPAFNSANDIWEKAKSDWFSKTIGWDIASKSYFWSTLTAISYLNMETRLKE
jgi:hypothetical protein